MDTLQTWVVVGVPALLFAAALFVGRSRVRALAGYALIAVTVLVFVVVPGDGVSAGIFGLMAVFLVANGRGTHEDERFDEHHRHRERYTRARSEA